MEHKYKKVHTINFGDTYINVIRDTDHYERMDGTAFEEPVGTLDELSYVIVHIDGTRTLVHNAYKIQPYYNREGFSK